METKTKKCQNCQKDFIIQPEDFTFYKKIDVPAPTWCPECRFQRRMSFRNERSLYSRKCDLCQKDMIAIYNNTGPYIVYCHGCWWSDEWNPISYGREYDFSKSFFKQFNELKKVVPLCGVFNIQGVNSEYCNFTYQSKNCYLNFASDMNEDTGYLYHSIENRDCFDMLGTRKSEGSYELVDCEKCYESDNLNLCEECIDCNYCYDCRSCQDCVGCTGLRNKKYHIFNQPYSKKDYGQRIKDLNLESIEGREKLKEEFSKILLSCPRKFSNSRHTVNSSGDYLKHVKNCHHCFDIEGPAEDLGHSAYGVTNMKSTYDTYAFGVNIENSYEVIGSGDNVQNIFFSEYIFSGSFSCEYSLLLNGCHDCFGCVALKNKSYCIFNKQYSKDEYHELVGKIKEQMKKDGEYGEFFPSNISPFAYNETIAQEYFPLGKDEVEKKGFRWKKDKERNYQITIQPGDIPDTIKSVDDGILKEVIGCATPSDERDRTGCTTAFKLTKAEFDFYKERSLPLPRFCPNCRHAHRLQQRNPFKLYKRSCMKEGCETGFETTYAPDRPEIVYCESCYNKEVV